MAFLPAIRGGAYSGGGYHSGACSNQLAMLGLSHGPGRPILLLEGGCFTWHPAAWVSSATDPCKLLLVSL